MSSTPSNRAPSPKRILVYDVGGSHVSAAVCLSDTHELLGLTHAPLPEPKPNPFSASSFGRLIHTLGETAVRAAHIDLTSVAGASFAFPGPFDYQAGISHMTHKLPSLNGVNLKADIAHRFRWQPDQVTFRNDADCFLLGEVVAGAARGYPRAVGLTLGTGIGSAFAVDGQIVTDGPGVPPGGEIWNLPYRDGIIEDYVSTRFLRHHFEQLTGLHADVSAIAAQASLPAPCPGDDEAAPPPAETRSQTSDPHCRARQSFSEFGHHLGLALNIALVQAGTHFRPDVIVFGGGIARASQLFFPETRKALAASPPVAVLVVSRLLDEAQLTGAGAHWFSSHSA
jgi:glucokinase